MVSRLTTRLASLLSPRVLARVPLLRRSQQRWTSTVHTAAAESILSTPPSLARQPSAPKRTASQRKLESLKLEAEALALADATSSLVSDAPNSAMDASPKRRGRSTASASPVAESTASTAAPSSPTKSPRGKRKTVGASQTTQEDVPVSQSQEPLPPPTEEQPKKKARARSNSRTASTTAPMEVDADGDAEVEAAPKKKGRAKSAGKVVAATDDVEAEAEPEVKKGRAKSAGGSGKKKAAAASGSQDGGSQEGVDETAATTSLVWPRPCWRSRRRSARHDRQDPRRSCAGT
jgi:hypothetical protein